MFKMKKKGDFKTMAVLIATLVGILLLVVIFYRVIFKGGILG